MSAESFADRIRVGRPLVIGEVAQSHDGSLGTAHAFVDAIADAGADAVKFQTHIAAAESTPSEPWRVPFSRQDASRYDYWRRMEFSPEQWRGLRDHALDRGLFFLSTAFSSEAVELLDDLDVAAWKVPSGEVVNLPLLRRMAETGRPVLLSTGLSRWAEIDAAVGVIVECNSPYLVMQCTTAYPTMPEMVGLNLIGEIGERYGCPTGLSDHSATIYPGLAAVALGARVVEVHVALSRRMFGPDVPASVTVEELAQLVEGTDHIHRSLSTPLDKDVEASAREELRGLFSRSLVARADLPSGHVVAAGDLVAKKPGTGLAPDRLDEVVGRRLVRPVGRDALLSLDDLEPSAVPEVAR